MRICVFLATLKALAWISLAADPVASKTFFKFEPLKLRSPEIERPYITTNSLTLELSTEASRQNLEASLRRFRAMNGKELLDLTPKAEPPPRPLRILNALFPGGGALGKNPNAPPGGFTR